MAGILGGDWEESSSVFGGGLVAVVEDFFDFRSFFGLLSDSFDSFFFCNGK